MEQWATADGAVALQFALMVILPVDMTRHSGLPIKLVTNGGFLKLVSNSNAKIRWKWETKIPLQINQTQAHLHLLLRFLTLELSVSIYALRLRLQHRCG